uniref:HECT domain-containing protein n=1 Tax=Salarias fasciatus TaxID=181472 RepID=A0A672H2K4_SALFA
VISLLVFLISIQISQATTLELVREAVNGAAEELAPMGGLLHLQTLEDKDDLLQAVTQFKDGLLTFGVLEEVVRNPNVLQSIFLEDTTPLSAKDLTDLFKPILSQAGSNRRRILVFATGLEKIPATGFTPQPELNFIHQEMEHSSRFPKANTCSLTLSIPVGLSYEDFKANMDFGIGQTVFYIPLQHYWGYGAGWSR